MRNILQILTITLIFFSCNEGQEGQQDKIPRKKNKIEHQKPTLDFSRFGIHKERIGKIKIGMTMSEADKLLKDLEKKDYSSTDLGFDGGSPATVYSYNNEPILATVSSLQSDSIVFLVAYHEKLRTANGLHPNMTVKELMKTYPDLLVHQDLMNDWEFADDSTNNWSFIFATDEKNEVGEYPTIEQPSKPKRLDVKADWITIK